MLCCTSLSLEGWWGDAGGAGGHHCNTVSWLACNLVSMSWLP
jgi:hypothetical protein